MSPSDPSEAAPPPSPWRPLGSKIFRNLLLAGLASDIGAFMQSVGAAWLMTSLSSNPLYIALIQTASALPLFLLALPAGSIGDIVDRRRLILAAELWMVAIATGLAVTTIAHAITPWLLLLFTLGISLGEAIEAPTWRAIAPELVKKEDLPAALALNGIEFNLARAVGPGLAGLLIAVAGIATVFVLNALSFLGVIFVIARWKRPVRNSKVPTETLGGASSAAVRYVRHSPAIRTLLLRAGCLVFFASCFWALLPTVARELSRSPVAYGFLLGFFGTGAILGAAALPRARSALSIEGLLSAATITFAVTVWSTAAFDRLTVLSVFMLFGGAAWTVFASLFNTMVQNLAPDWVRARVLAVYLFVFQGSIAAGSAFWGFVAERTSAHVTLLLAGIGIGACLLLQFPVRLPNPPADLSPWNHWARPHMFEEHAPDLGPVLVTVRYVVDPARASEFLKAIYRYERIRRRDGATRWEIFYDTEVPNVYLETFLVDSWAEHQRQHDRFTVADRELEKRVLSYALEPTEVKHYIHAQKSSRS